MFEVRLAYLAVEEGPIGSDQAALHNSVGCESGMNVHGLLLC